MRLKIKWRDGLAYDHGTGPSGLRSRRALKTRRSPRRKLRTDLENRLWRGNLYGVDVVTTFRNKLQCRTQKTEAKRFLIKISEQLAGVSLNSITPQIVRNAAKKAYPNHTAATRNRRGITPAASVINLRPPASGGAAPYE